MKSYQAALVLLASSAVAHALPGGLSASAHSSSRSAHPSSGSAHASATKLPDHAPHKANHAPAINPAGKDDSKAVAQKCIQFTSDNPNWQFANTGVWGSETGAFGNGRTVCVNNKDKAGGAMFIGTGNNPQGGNTKLECFFPTSGTANCDISLVDGYSLSVTCNAGGQKMGGDIDLWTTGKPCADTSEKNAGICKNDQGYAAAQSDVTPFFQDAIQNGNQYCIWVNCNQDYYFPVGADMTCHVSGTGVN